VRSSLRKTNRDNSRRVSGGNVPVRDSQTKDGSVTALTTVHRQQAAKSMNDLVAMYAEKAKSRGVVMKTDGLTYWSHNTKLVP
jgi:hypothetical protein